jgi:hypothetical protein
MDIRFLAWAGYQLNVCGDIQEVTASVPVCAPVVDGIEVGTKRFSGRGTKVLVSAKELKPNVKAEDV